MIQDEFTERHIDSLVNVKIVEARQNHLVFRDGSEYAFDFSLVIPSFVRSTFVRGVDGLPNR